MNCLFIYYWLIFPKNEYSKLHDHRKETKSLLEWNKLKIQPTQVILCYRLTNVLKNMFRVQRGRSMHSSTKLKFPPLSAVFIVRVIMLTTNRKYASFIIN